MTVLVPSRARVSRRRFLKAATASAAMFAGTSIGRPYLSRAADRPLITHGIQSGDVCEGSAIVWARADRPARMLVEVATSESFKTICDAQFVDALPETDCTGKVLLEDLPPGQEMYYRIAFADHAFPTIVGETQVGHFRTAAGDCRRGVSFVWSGDTAGQGWGIDEARGGMRSYATMLRHDPDFFIHCGDSIYADCPIPACQTLPDGRVWRNVVTEEKSKVAETLAEFRGNYKYNLLDASVRAFNAQVPTLAQWDDHEVTNDWCPGEEVSKGILAGPTLLQLVARGHRAFYEFMPIRETLAQGGRIYRKVPYGPSLDIFLLDMRSYRTANSMGRNSVILGSRQLGWLKRELVKSRATWKVIAADLPIGIVSGDAVALGDGPPEGRELEIADLSRFIGQAGLNNIVWITADMHYTAAHYYDPNRAVFQDFEPFWEFVSGPLHAGTWKPGKLDNTFGPQAVYQNGCSEQQGDNLAPCFGLQFFGHVFVDGETQAMTVTLRDVADRNLWSTRIEPKTRKWSGRSELSRG
jgi:alkaline phosphatase D